ncbi:protein NO VEIN domain-containing protein [Geomonas anaerohicana]|uniref:DUF3883 domain-containing protein n=1 Tax=Geomonas anaerohicana TaxID=2798583 RepID=A0ABS0YEL5_9BACT|nr:DUF3883 domain-containing protein [Geomonas anaerohicana]MBJ6750743.1 DUF3883 domain-containing protein [Geomonas anaerohicana]
MTTTYETLHLAAQQAWQRVKEEILFPKYSEITGPLVAELKRRGGSSKPSEQDQSGKTVYEALADHFGLSQEARDFRIYEANGAERSKWHNMVRWTRNDLVKSRMLSSAAHGLWTLTDKGNSLALNYLYEKAGQGLVQRGGGISLERFKQLLAEAKRVGEKGEDIVLRFEKQRLRTAGKISLANLVKQVSRVDVGAGYDILSFDVDGGERYIEVKSSKAKTAHSFELSGNEYKVAQVYRNKYFIYLVSDVDGSGDIIQLQDPFALHTSGRLILRASGYSVTIAEGV